MAGFRRSGTGGGTPTRAHRRGPRSTSLPPDRTRSPVIPRNGKGERGSAPARAPVSPRDGKGGRSSATARTPVSVGEGTGESGNATATVQSSEDMASQIQALKETLKQAQSRNHQLATRGGSAKRSASSRPRSLTPKRGTPRRAQRRAQL